MATDIRKSAIEQEVDSICASPVFASAPRMQQLLRFLVEQALAGNESQLKAYTIGLEVFGRSDDFNPQSDPVVRVEMRRLRSKLNSYYAEHPACEVMVDIPKGGYIPEFIAANSPQCLSRTDRSAELLHLAASSEIDISVMVMPFEDLSQDDDMERLGIGLAVEITAALTKFPRVCVAGLHYVRQMLRRGYSMPEMAKLTKSGFVICGSLQVQGQTLRLVVELTDASTGVLLCANCFEYPYNPEDLFKLQDKITWQVLSSLAEYLHLASNFFQNAPTRIAEAKPDTYEAILRYSAWESSLNPEHFSKARNALEEVVDIKGISPQTAAMLADIYASEYKYGSDHTPDALNKALELSEQALSEDPNSPIACLAQAMYYYLQRDQRQLQRALYRVVSLKPNYNNVLSSAAGMLISSGDLEKGKEILDSMSGQSEFMPWWHYIPVFMLNYTIGNYEHALYATMHMRNNNHFYGPLFSAVVYTQLNMRTEAEQALQELLAVHPDFPVAGRRVLNGIFFFEQSVDHFVEVLEKLGLRFS